MQRALSGRRASAWLCSLTSVLWAACAAPALPQEEVAATTIRILANYPATLVYALDAAAGERHTDVGYRQWLLGSEPAPWLDTYRDKRQSWMQTSAATDGPPAFDVCAWEARTLHDAIACMYKIVPRADHAFLATVLRLADARLAPRWMELSAPLSRLAPAVERLVASAKSTELLRELRRVAGLAPSVPFDFRVVLVAKPASDRSFARQAGRYLVHEVDPDETAGQLVGVAFHEAAHWAHEMSPNRDEMERALVPFGAVGVLAGGIWDEAVAAAFGNGLAASELDPAFRATKSFYIDQWIDVLGQQLFVEWRYQPVRLGAPFAERFVRIVEQHWPEQTRPMNRYLWQVSVHATTRAPVKELLRNVDYRNASRSIPVDDSLPLLDGQPPWAPQIVLLTAAELAQRPKLQARFQIPDQSWRDAVAASGATAFRHDEANKAMLFMIVAETAEQLTVAAGVFSKLPALIPVGWTSLARP